MKKIAEHSGCGWGNQFDQITVSIPRGEVVVQLSADEYQAMLATQPARPDGQAVAVQFAYWALCEEAAQCEGIAHVSEAIEGLPLAFPGIAFKPLAPPTLADVVAAQSSPLRTIPERPKDARAPNGRLGTIVPAPAPGKLERLMAKTAAAKARAIAQGEGKNNELS